MVSNVKDVVAWEKGLAIVPYLPRGSTNWLNVWLSQLLKNANDPQPSAFLFALEESGSKSRNEYFHILSGRFSLLTP